MGGPPTFFIPRVYDTGVIVALFPAVLADDIGCLCDSYAEGTHAAVACHDVLDQTREATDEEEATIALELEGQGYTHLIAKKKETGGDARRAPSRSPRIIFRSVRKNLLTFAPLVIYSPRVGRKRGGDGWTFSGWFTWAR